MKGPSRYWVVFILLAVVPVVSTGQDVCQRVMAMHFDAEWAGSIAAESLRGRNEMIAKDLMKWYTIFMCDMPSLNTFTI